MPLIPGFEPHSQSVTSKLNWLRAGVLGANDGIVSTAGLVMGVAGATAVNHTLFISGMAGMLAGALSMAVGEYVSVSTQRDTECAARHPNSRRVSFVTTPTVSCWSSPRFYKGKGLTHDVAHHVATELTANNALAAHLDVELGIDPDDLTNPWHAGIASFFAFLIGAAIPLAAILLSPSNLRVAVTTRQSHHGPHRIHQRSVGRGQLLPAVVRNVFGGTLVMIITYSVGTLIGGTGSGSGPCVPSPWSGFAAIFGCGIARRSRWRPSEGTAAWPRRCRSRDPR